MMEFTGEVLGYGAPGEIIVEEGRSRWFVRGTDLPTLYAGDYVHVRGTVEGTDLILADLVTHIDEDGREMAWI